MSIGLTYLLSQTFVFFCVCILLIIYNEKKICTIIGMLYIAFLMIGSVLYSKNEPNPELQIEKPEIIYHYKAYEGNIGDIKFQAGDLLSFYDKEDALVEGEVLFLPGEMINISSAYECECCFDFTNMHSFMLGMDEYLTTKGLVKSKDIVSAIERLES